MKKAGDAPDTAKGRRGFLKRGAALATGAASAGLAQGANAQGLAGQPWERVYGAGFTGYGQPSRFEQPVVRHIGRPYGDLAPGSGAALSPIESLEGVITPSSLHNIRSHSGTPDIDPKQHRLAGGIGSLAGRTPQRTVGSYWPYATTLFDYVRRAMPITNPLSLTDDEVYAVSAYVLFLNGIVGEDAVMNAQTLPQVKMPNRDGFVSDWPPRARN